MAWFQRRKGDSAEVEKRRPRLSPIRGTTGAARRARRGPEGSAGAEGPPGPSVLRDPAACSRLWGDPPNRVRAQDSGFGGVTMMWAPAVPGNMSQGASALGEVDKPVDSGVANGM
jgi:hypothetical protein